MKLHKYLQIRTKAIVLFSIILTSLFFAQATLAAVTAIINYSGLGAADSAGDDFKTLNESKLAVSNEFVQDVNEIYVGNFNYSSTSVVTIKAYGEAGQFDIADMQFRSWDNSPRTIALFEIRFLDMASNEVGPNLSVSDYTFSTAENLAAIFGSFSSRSGVAEIEVTITGSASQTPANVNFVDLDITQFYTPTAITLSDFSFRSMIEPAPFLLLTVVAIALSAIVLKQRKSSQKFEMK